MTNYTIHKSESRGHANHGWLNAYHSFSFASWYNPDRVNFGVLRVLNDDTIAGGMGFGTHPDNNVQIIPIPHDGNLKHKTLRGNAATAITCEFKVLSAGTGIQHSEFNPNPDQQTKLFQIWLFPKYKDVTPRYQQITLDIAEQKNNFAQVLSPNAEDAGVWIYQDAWFYLAAFDANYSKTYTIRKAENGMYIFVISGTITVDNQIIETRDGLGVTDFKTIEITATTDAKFLLMEIPMN